MSKTSLKETLKGKILVTGGAGYIGSTICSALLDNGWTPIVLDNLSSGPRSFTDDRIFYEGDIADKDLLKKIFTEQGSIEATIHCAARIVVPESVSQPELYFRENVSKSVELFAMLRDLGCKKIVYSSSAAIYDVVDGFMAQEDSPLRPLSPYARTKFMMEWVLQDYCGAYDMRGISLRYFNPIGADPKMRTGSYIKNPTHILGRMLTVASGRDSIFEITGTDWPTRDGSGIRDYIHVWDLARAHVRAIDHFDQAFVKPQPHGAEHKNYRVINLGSGRGVTVLELVAAFENVIGKKLNKKISPRRAGDVAGAFASGDTAMSLIDWKAELSVEQGIRDAITWASKYFK